MHSEQSPPEDRLEQELGHALRRVKAPAGFADAVLCRIEAEPEANASADEMRAARPAPSPSFAALRGFWSRQWRSMQFTPARAGLAAALLLVLILPLGGSLYQRHREAQAERAVRQFALAMRLTHAALLDAGQHVAERGRSRNP